MRCSSELIKAAQALYLKRHTPKEIAKSLYLKNVRIIYYWAEKYKWSLLLSEESVEDAINRRLALLVGRDNKKELELKEIENLVIQHVKLINARAKNQLKTELTPAAECVNTSTRGQDFPQNDKPSKKTCRKRKNDVSGITKEDFDEVAQRFYIRTSYMLERIKQHHVIVLF